MNPNKFVARTIELLQSSNPFEIAAGLAAATGRRFSEVVDKGSLTATTSSHWVQFAGQLKKSTEAGNYFAPCLIPAADVLAALKRFRKHRRIARLAGQSPSQINRSLANSVKRSVKRHFQDTQIIPVLEGEAEVTIHNLRGVYGEIAVHYFCSPSQGTARFVQARLGHVISEEEFKRANATATQHYFHYYLIDEDGQHIGSKGVKLASGGQPPAIDEAEDLAIAPVPEATLEPPVVEQPDSTNSPEQAESIEAIASLPAVEESESIPLTQDSPTLEPTDATSTPVDNEAIASLREQVASLSQAFTQEIEKIWSCFNEMNTQAPAPAATDTSFFTREIESLRQQLVDRQHERDQAAAERDALHAENTELQRRIEAMGQEYEQQKATIEQGYQYRIEQLTKIINETPPTASIAVPSSETEPPAAPQPESPKVEQAIVITAPAATPNSEPTPSAQPKPKHNTARGSADKRVEAALLAIMEWNRHHSALDDKFTITQSLLQKTTGSNMPAIKRVMGDFQNEIVEHNMEQGIDDDRHNYGKDLTAIKQFVGQRL